MHEMETFAALARWAGRTFALNLGYLPEEKLEWKPEPGARSAAEVTGEVAGLLDMGVTLLTTGEFGLPQPTPPATIAAGQEAIRAATARYADALTAASPETLARIVDSPFPVGRMQIGRAALFPLVDMLHHNGQLCYLQSLLGNTDSHQDHGALQAFLNPGAHP